MKSLRRLSVAVIGTTITALGVLTCNQAYAAGNILKIIPFFSLKWVVAKDENGNPIFNMKVALDGDKKPILDQNGNPVFNKIAKHELRVDPTGVDILAIGVDLSFDPNEIQVVTDLSGLSQPLKSAFGFYCDFSVNGSCPEFNDPFIPNGYGDPLPGSTSSLNIDNALGKFTLSYDFSDTPVTVTDDTNIFGFLFEPVVVGIVDGIYTLPPESVPFVQSPNSSQQFCITTETERTGLQCSISVPEPTSTLSLLALSTLGAASTLKRQIKSCKTSEKETTKVG